MSIEGIDLESDELSSKIRFVTNQRTFFIYKGDFSAIKLLISSWEYICRFIQSGWMIHPDEQMFNNILVHETELDLVPDGRAVGNPHEEDF